MEKLSLIIIVSFMILGCEDYTQESLIEDTNEIKKDTDSINELIRQSVVGLASEDDYVAGGTGILITPTLVLTVGHGGTSECSDMSIPRNFVIRIGQDSKYPIEEIKVLKEIEHPLYGVGNPNIGNVSCSKEKTPDCCGGGWGIDLGIWVLERPATLAKPVSYFGSIEAGESVILFGYGPSSSDSKENYGTLKIKIGKIDYIVENAGQGDYLSPTGGKRMYSSDINSIPGDSGGPYFNIQGELVAIHTSHGNIYAVGQILEPYLDWVLSINDD